LLRICAGIQLRFAHQPQSPSRRPRRQNPTKQDPTEPRPAHLPPPPQETRPRSSLLDDLFPDLGDVRQPSRVAEDDIDSKLEALIYGAKESDILDLTNPDLLRKAYGDSNFVGSQASSSSDKQNVQVQRDANVLVLSNASKSLSESDFMRLGAKGKHIAGWTGGITKVIPGRDPDGLQQLGHYFLVFSTVGAASAYHDQIIRLHTLARNKTPTPGRPVALPPRGYVKDGEDIEAMVKAFTLVPSSQKDPAIRLLKKPVQPAVQDLVNHGGHKVVDVQLPKSKGKVLLSLYGDLNAADIRTAILNDGRERNLEWNLWDHDGIVQIGAAKAEQLDLAQHDDPLQDKKTVPLAKFIVTLKDITEARSFIRSWHRRPFPRQQEQSEPDGLPPLVNVELLW